MPKISNGDFSLVLDDAQYDALVKKMELLTDIEKEEVINTALKKGTTLLTESGKQHLVATILHPEDSTGRLLKSMNIKVLKAKKNKGPVGYSGFRRSTRNNKSGGGNAAHLVDRGTVDRYTKKGYYRGKVKGSLFWTSTVQQEGDKAIELLLNAIDEAIENIWNKK